MPDKKQKPFNIEQQGNEDWPTSDPKTRAEELQAAELAKEKHDKEAALKKKGKVV
jgi:hypothetical protein